MKLTKIFLFLLALITLSSCYVVPVVEIYRCETYSNCQTYGWAENTNRQVAINNAITACVANTPYYCFCPNSANCWIVY